MGLRIGTNIASLSSQRNLETNRSSEEKSLRRLSSGSRIVQAADDAAGLSIASTINARVRSSKQAARNAQDGVSLIQVAEGAIQEIGNILVRFRELGIQAASDTIGNTERKMINREVTQLRDEVDRITESTEFNGKKILSGGGSWPLLDVQIGIDHDENSRLEIDRSKFDLCIDHLGLHEIDFSTKEEAQNRISDIDDALSVVSGRRATLGSLQNRFASIINNLNTNSENLSAAKSRIMDADIAQETSELTKSQILTSASLSTLAQANQNPKLALKLLEN